MCLENSLAASGCVPRPNLAKPIQFHALLPETGLFHCETTSFFTDTHIHTERFITRYAARESFQDFIAAVPEETEYGLQRSS